MSFAVLPPEVTSAQMYSGAGSGPMLAAAASWSGLGSELGSAASSFSSVTSDLVSGAWQGAASAAMASVATQYAQWLSTAAAHASGAAGHANTIAGIFEAAKAAVAHPAAVAVNRRQLVQLVRSNLFGFNAPAIAATEGAYESMWAQNVAALSGYHGAASAVATQLQSGAQALQALPAAAVRAPVLTGIKGAQENNQQVIAALRRQNASDLARTQAQTRSDLSAVSSAGLQTAARDVADAGLINVGTGLRVGGRTVFAAPLLAGQDLDILGGAGPLRAIALQAQAAVPIGPGIGGGGTPEQQVMNYDRQQWQGFERLTEYQASTTQGLTHSDLSAAATALGKGDVVTAAERVGDAAAINVGTGLQVATRAGSFVPATVGADFDILGDGSDLLGVAVRVPD
jgi:PPE-repeat protein